MPADTKLFGPDGRPSPGNNLAAFQEYTDKQVAMYVARDRAEVKRAAAADDYKKALTAIASSRVTEAMIQDNAAARFVEMQARYQAWCKAQDAIDNDQKRIRDEILAKQAEEKAAQTKLEEAALKEKEKEAGLLQGKDVAAAIAAGTPVGGFGSGLPPAPPVEPTVEVPVAEPVAGASPNPA